MSSPELPARKSRSARPFGSPLTASELRSLQAIAEGHTVGYAARVAGVSHHTVRTQLEHAYQRLGVSKGAHAVALVCEAGQLKVPQGGRIELSDLQRQILTRMARGKRDKEIRTELGVKAHVFRYLVESLYSDLGARNRSHAVYRGFQTGNLQNRRKEKNE